MFNHTRQNGADGWIERCSTFVLDHGRLFLLAGLLILVGGLVSATGLHWDEDVLDLLPRDDPHVSDFLRLMERFDTADYLYFDVGPVHEHDSVSEEELIEHADGFYQRLVDSNLFKRIIYEWQPADVLQAMAVVTGHRASLFTEDDAEQLTDKLTLEAIADALRDWRRTLTESPAPFLSEAFYEDPLAINDIFAAKLQALQALGTSLVVRKGRMFSRDHKHILGIALPRFRSTDSRNSERLIEVLSDARDAIQQGDSSGRLRIAYFGGHVASLENARQIKSDIKLTVVLSVAGIALLSLLVYRRWYFAILTFVPVVFGGALALGAIRWLDPSISAISIGCGSMLIGISIDYAIHVVYSADQIEAGSDARGAVIHTLRRLFTPIVLSAGTTLGAFCVLHFSVIPGYRDLGHFAALGITGAALSSLVLLPIIVRRVLASRGRRPLWRLTAVFPVLVRFAAGSRTTHWLILVAISAVASAGVGRLTVEGDVRKLNSVSAETRGDWDQLVSVFGDVMSSTAFGIEAGDLEVGLQDYEVLSSVLAQCTERGYVKNFSALSGLLPSNRTQIQNRTRWGVFWDDARLAEVRRHFGTACKQLRMRPAAFAHFFESLQSTASPIGTEDYQEGLLRDLLTTHLSRRGDDVILLTRVKLSTADAFQHTSAAVKNVLPNALSFNGQAFVQDIAELIHHEMARLALVTLVFIVVVLSLCVRRVRLVAAMLVPLALSVFWTSGFLGLLGIHLNMMNSAVAVFILGLIVDYSIFLALAIDKSAQAQDEHVLRTCGAITISALTTLCGMGALVVARHPALHSIGATALVGIGSGLIAVFVVVPLFVRPGRLPA